MTLQDVQEQALQLSTEDRWQLMDALMRSLQPRPKATEKPPGITACLTGIAKTDEPALTDEEINAALDERLQQKYL